MSEIHTLPSSYSYLDPLFSGSALNASPPLSGSALNASPLSTDANASARHETDGIELVFGKPHSNIFPTMDQSHELLRKTYYLTCIEIAKWIKRLKDEVVVQWSRVQIRLLFNF
ncbi:hypothetical protein OUZ56_032890 [Daphnia magna]|uniref:Uncharacterized protein n=1 Tax=Daphnia magna TaxID=35525 RepID=A0ABR0B9T7_9CRUS|nr:hypothetical protein OUZ56_032890 [Daphnia magna]